MFNRQCQIIVNPFSAPPIKPVLCSSSTLQLCDSQIGCICLNTTLARKCKGHNAKVGECPNNEGCFLQDHNGTYYCDCVPGFRRNMLGNCTAAPSTTDTIPILIDDIIPGKNFGD